MDEQLFYKRCFSLFFSYPTSYISILVWCVCKTKGWFRFSSNRSTFVLLDHFGRSRALNVSFVVCRHTRRVAGALGTKPYRGFDLKPFGTVATHYWETCFHGKRVVGKKDRPKSQNCSFAINTKETLDPGGRGREKIHVRCEGWKGLWCCWCTTITNQPDSPAILWCAMLYFCTTLITKGTIHQHYFGSLL